MKKRGIKNCSNDKSKRYILFVVAGSLVTLAALCGCILSAQSTHADNTASNSTAVSVTVATACTLTGGSDGTSTSDSTYSVTVPSNNYREINGSKLTTICNDAAGYSIYAIGYSGNSYAAPGNTTMISPVGSINTNLNTSGSTSGWAMQVAKVSGNAPEIMNGFDSYHEIPGTYAQVARYTGPTGSSTDTGAQVQTKYRIFISSAQAASTYTGKVKYTMIHPNNSAAPQVPVPLADATYMQDAIDCANTPVGTVKTLTDARDSQSYFVGKAADGNCWMLQNLKLGKTTTSTTLTAADSDVSNNFVLNNKLSDGRFHAYTVDGVSNQNNNSEYYCTEDYGCYYNWYTATAGTGTTDISTSQAQATASICPAGWALPSLPQFLALYSSYPSAALMEVDNPTTTKENTTGKIPGFLLSGSYYAGGAYNLGSGGSYWSRSAFSAQFAYYLYLNTSGVTPAGNNYKYVGFAVRCVLK